MQNNGGLINRVIDMAIDKGKTALKTCTTHVRLKEYNYLYVFHQTNINAEKILCSTKQLYNKTILCSTPQPRKSTFLYSHMLNSELIFSVDIIRDSATAGFGLLDGEQLFVLLVCMFRPLEILRKQEKWFIERSNLIIFSSVYLFI
ncbi:hypothetical protein ACJX0J_019676, partial [Zea mays]